MFIFLKNILEKIYIFQPIIRSQVRKKDFFQFRQFLRQGLLAKKKNGFIIRL